MAQAHQFAYWPCLPTGRVSCPCQISTLALKRWMRNGRGLVCKPPGGCRRIGLEEMQRFLQQRGMPPAPGPVPNICTLITYERPVIGHLIVSIFAARHGATISTPQECMRRAQHGKKLVGFADADIQLLHELSPVTDMQCGRDRGGSVYGQSARSLRSTAMKLPIVVQSSECPQGWDICEHTLKPHWSGM